MGTWGIGISSNDEYMDIYYEIMEDFNKGIPIQTVLDRVLKENESAYADDPNSLHNLYFAIANAGWECGVSDNKLLNKVKDIIESGKDIKCWEELGASKSDIIKREKALRAFLEKISTPTINVKKPKPLKFKPAIFEKGDILSIRLEDETYTGAVVLDNVKASDEFGSNFIVKAYLNKPQTVTIEEILSAKVYDYAWYLGVHYKKYIDRIQVIGKIEIKNQYDWNGIGSTHSSWSNFISANNTDYYCLKDNSNIKNIETFLKFSPKEIATRQAESI